MDGLEDFLKGSETDEADPVPAEPTGEVVADTVATEPAVDQQPAEPKAEQPRGPDGKFLPKGEPEPPAVTASPAVEEPQLDHAALIGERRRRQEAEQRIAEYEARLAQQPQQPPPDFWEDPDQAFNHRLNTVLPEITERIRSELRVERVKESAEEARSRYQDYDQTIDVFHQLASQNPALGQQMLMSRDPAEFAYKTAKTHQQVTQYGSIDALIEAEVAKRLTAQPAPTPAPPIPDTLADAQSARGTSAEPFKVPTLDDILKR